MKQDINKLILTEAAYYNANISQLTLQLWASEYEKIGPVKLETMFKKLRVGRKTIPAPADVFNALDNSLDQTSIATLAASRTIEAVSKFGSWNPEEAEAHIGQLGWCAVHRFGGWKYVCENLGVSLDVTTFQAQLRNICVADLKAIDNGIYNQPIGLDYKEKNNEVSSLQKPNPMQYLENIKKG